MIDAKRFIELWTKEGDELVRFPCSIVEELFISPESKSILMNAGLPKGAAPFLSFGLDSDCRSLPIASEEWHLSQSYNIYRIIGSTGKGDPVCLDESAKGIVVYLDHERHFEKVFVNSSVVHLNESLLAYREFVRKVIEQNGKDAYLDGFVPRYLADWISSELSRIDKPAMENGRFWKIEIESEFIF